MTRENERAPSRSARNDEKALGRIFRSQPRSSKRRASMTDANGGALGGGRVDSPDRTGRGSPMT